MPGRATWCRRDGFPIAPPVCGTPRDGRPASRPMKRRRRMRWVRAWRPYSARAHHEVAFRHDRPGASDGRSRPRTTAWSSTSQATGPPSRPARKVCRRTARSHLKVDLHRRHDRRDSRRIAETIPISKPRCDAPIQLPEMPRHRTADVEGVAARARDAILSSRKPLRPGRKPEPRHRRRHV